MTTSLSTDKTSYAPGEAVTVTANYSDPATTATVTITATVEHPSGQVDTANTSYTVVPPATTPTAKKVSAVDDKGGTYTLQSNNAGVATLLGTAAAPSSVVSGYGGAEPLPAAAGPSVTWEGYTWETEDWGTAPGQPKASNVTITPSGALVLNAGLVGSVYAGSEIDSARGDQGIAGNTSTWGYGTYRWGIGGDLTRLPIGMCLGLFTFWSKNKGGPAGQKEIDIEFYSADTIAGAPAFVQLGHYQDTTAGITQGVPDGHVLLPGSQFAIPAGLQSLTAEFTWLPSSITWKLTGPDGATLVTVTATDGQSYKYTQLYGGNQFAGTVSIPKTGKQQVIANLWCPNGTAPNGNPLLQVPVTSFTYTQP